MDTSPTESPSERGPEEAALSFEAVFEAEFSYVCRTLRRLGIAERDLDDVAQEVFVAVYRRYSDYDPERPVRPWLFSFALRVAANYRRLAKHRREVPEPEREVAGKGLTPEGLAARNEARALVHKGLEKLDFDRRVVLVMHDIDGFSVPEISQVLSVKVNTVYSRLRLARRDFERAVRRIQAQGGVR
jgi:RNA polymerase sigma-70 factor (ECF subfamily)